MTVAWSIVILGAIAVSASEYNSSNDDSDWSAYLQFPDDFIIGASTASYQIEGSWNVSGKGESVWDHFIHTNRSRIKNNDDADIACDSYRQYKVDIALLKQLGFQAYRFSISWPRILPGGFANEINQAGIDHYKNMIDELLANDIEPVVAMLHWDHPQVFEELGGWTNEAIIKWFVDYADVLFRELGPKVKKWITMNEPDTRCQNGYCFGVHAPGITVHGFAEYMCIHNSLKAHAAVYRLYERKYKSSQHGLVGIIVNMLQYYPKTPGVDDEAAEIAFQFSNGWMFHPIFSSTGDYPQVLKSLVAQKSAAQGYPESRLPVLSPEWIDVIRGSADFLGLNHYTSWLVEAGPNKLVPSFLDDRGLNRFPDPSWKPTASSWLHIVPKGFGDLLRKIASEYNNPLIYVTENGASDRGQTLDFWRVQFFHDYVKELLIAVNRDGVNVKGYFIWSFLDNFEWEQGYSERFGIVSVNFDDPARPRRPKESAYWWSRVLRSRRLEPIMTNLNPNNVNDEIRSH